MKLANKLIKKNDRAGLLAAGFSETRILRLFTPDYAGRLGFPAYAITNNAANIRRVKERIKDLAAVADDVTSEMQVNGIKIIDSVEDNRIQIFFPGKPEAAVIAALKSRGFHWTPSLQCWQRMRSAQALYEAKRIVE